MASLLQLCSLLVLGAGTSSAATRRPQPIRNVSVDELLAYGIVVHPDPGLDPSQLHNCGAPHQGVASACPQPPPPPLPPSQPFSTGDSLDSGGMASASTNDDGAASRLPDSDIVFASGTCMKRIRLACASRAWRGPAVRAFFLTDSQKALRVLNERGAAVGEAYGFFPSEGAPELGGWVRSLRGGDTRAAAAPFAAHRHFGETYKWLLYGDDDTVFFLDAVKQLLADLDLDPDQPIALSDNLWFSGRHPNPNAPRCLPCRLANKTLPSLEEIFKSVYGRVDIRATRNQQEGVPVLSITEGDYLRFATNSTQVPGERYRPEPACGTPSSSPGSSSSSATNAMKEKEEAAGEEAGGGEGEVCTRRAACAPVEASRSAAPCTASVAHGGAGMIFSVGLMRSITYHDALSCFLTFTNASGGDHMVSECLWRHGFAFTDPGPLVLHKYDYQYVVFGGSPRLPLLLGLGPPYESVAAGAHCDKHCRWMLQHAVSIHLGARKAKDLKVVAALQEAVPRIRRDALNRINRRHSIGR